MRTGLLFATSFTALALAGCGPKPADPAPAVTETPIVAETSGPSADAAGNDVSACGPVSAAGYCGVTVGMAADAATKAYPGGLTTYATDEQIKADPNMCHVLATGAGVNFLAEGGKVGRIDVMNEGPVTADGFGVGSEEAAIKAKHADATSTPNKYEPAVSDLSYSDGSGKIIFEIEGGKARAWRAGVAPTIDYVEACG